MGNILNSQIKKDYIDEENIRLLVDLFYIKIRADKYLGPIFEKVIGHEPEQWRIHLHTMYHFWSSILLRSGRYHGNPLKKHIELPTFDLALFDQWLRLFAETAHELYTPDMADHYIAISKRIATRLKTGIRMTTPEIF